MLTKEKIIEKLKEKHPYLASEYGVKRIGLFGSYARGEQSERSDIDILAEFNQPIGFKFIEFTEYLEEILGREVDVLTPAGIKSIRIKNIIEDIEESIVYV